MPEIRCSDVIVRAQEGPVEDETVFCESVPSPTSELSTANGRALAPGVRALVDSYARAPFVATDTSASTLLDAAPACAGEIDAIGILLIGTANPATAVLGGFKVGWDLGECLALRENARMQEEAVAYCESAGGTPKALFNGVLTCEVPRRLP